MTSPSPDNTPVDPLDAQIDNIRQQSEVVREDFSRAWGGIADGNVTTGNQFLDGGMSNATRSVTTTHNIAQHSRMSDAPHQTVTAENAKELSNEDYYMDGNFDMYLDNNPGWPGHGAKHLFSAIGAGTAAGALIHKTQLDTKGVAVARDFMKDQAAKRVGEDFEAYTARRAAEKAAKAAAKEGAEATAKVAAKEGAELAVREGAELAVKEGAEVAAKRGGARALARTAGTALARRAPTSARVLAKASQVAGKKVLEKAGGLGARRALGFAASRLGGRAAAMAGAALIPGPGWAAAAGIALTIGIEAAMNPQFRGWMSTRLRGGGIAVDTPPVPPTTHIMPPPPEGENPEKGRAKAILDVDTSLATALKTYFNMSPEDTRVWDIENPNVKGTTRFTGVPEEISKLGTVMNDAIDTMSRGMDGMDGRLGETLREQTVPMMNYLGDFADKAGKPWAASSTQAATTVNDMYQAIREANAASREALATTSHGRWFGHLGDGTVDEDKMTDNSAKIKELSERLKDETTKMSTSIQPWLDSAPPVLKRIIDEGRVRVPNLPTPDSNPTTRPTPTTDTDIPGMDNKDVPFPGGGGGGFGGGGFGGGGGFSPGWRPDRSRPSRDDDDFDITAPRVKPSDNPLDPGQTLPGVDPLSPGENVANAPVFDPAGVLPGTDTGTGDVTGLDPFDPAADGGLTPDTTDLTPGSDTGTGVDGDGALDTGFDPETADFTPGSDSDTSTPTSGDYGVSPFDPGSDGGLDPDDLPFGIDDGSGSTTGTTTGLEGEDGQSLDPFEGGTHTTAGGFNAFDPDADGGLGEFTGGSDTDGSGLRDANAGTVFAGTDDGGGLGTGTDDPFSASAYGGTDDGGFEAGAGADGLGSDGVGGGDGLGGETQDPFASGVVPEGASVGADGTIMDAQGQPVMGADGTPLTVDELKDSGFDTSGLTDTDSGAGSVGGAGSAGGGAGFDPVGDGGAAGSGAAPLTVDTDGDGVPDAPAPGDGAVSGSADPLDFITDTTDGSNPWDSVLGDTGMDGEDTVGTHTAEVDGKTVAFDSEAAAKLADDITNPDVATDGNIRDVLNERGFHVPADGDPGAPIGPAETRAGDMLFQEGKGYMVIAPGELVDVATGEVSAFGDVVDPAVQGDSDGFYRLDSGEGLGDVAGGAVPGFEPDSDLPTMEDPNAPATDLPTDTTDPTPPADAPSASVGDVTHDGGADAATPSAPAAPTSTNSNPFEAVDAEAAAAADPLTVAEPAPESAAPTASATAEPSAEPTAAADTSAAAPADTPDTGAAAATPAAPGSEPAPDGSWTRSAEAPVGMGAGQNVPSESTPSRGADSGLNPVEGGGASRTAGAPTNDFDLGIVETEYSGKPLDGTEK